MESQGLTEDTRGLTWLGMLGGSDLGTKRIGYCTERFFNPLLSSELTRDHATELGHAQLGVPYVGSSSQCLFRCETNNQLQRPRKSVCHLK